MKWICRGLRSGNRDLNVSVNPACSMSTGDTVHALHAPTFARRRVAVLYVGLRISVARRSSLRRCRSRHG